MLRRLNRAVQIPRVHPGYMTPVMRTAHGFEIKEPPKLPYIHPSIHSGPAWSIHTVTRPHKTGASLLPLRPRTAGARTHREPPDLIPLLADPHQVRLERLLLGLIRLVAVHPYLEVLVAAHVLERDVVLAAGPLLERDREAPASEPRYARDLL